MSTFNEREKGYEAKFKADEESLFRAEARRNKMLGAWAAALLKKEDVAGYISEVVNSDLDEPGPEDVVRKVMADFKSANVPMTEETLRRKMDEFFAQARMEDSGKN